MSRDQKESTQTSQDPKETYWDEEWLRQKYHEEELTMGEIADQVDVHRSTIQSWIDKHDIERQKWGTLDDPELNGWNRIDVNDNLTRDERAKLRDRQREIKQPLQSMREERDRRVEQFAKEAGYDLDEVSERLDAKSDFSSTEQGEAFERKFKDKLQEVHDDLAKLHSQFLEKRFDSTASKSKKHRICVLKQAFGSEANVYAVADAADSSYGYVREFSAFQDITVSDSGYVTRHYDETAHEKGEPPIILQRERRRSSSHSQSKREKVLERDGHQCLRCGSDNSLEIHHITPVANGGGHEMANLATLCSECHNDAVVVGAHKQVTAYPPGEFEAWLNDDLDICGARTSKDGRCHNPAGSCPHHG